MGGVVRETGPHDSVVSGNWRKVKIFAIIRSCVSWSFPSCWFRARGGDARHLDRHPAIHLPQDELMANWQIAINGGEVYKINPFQA